MTIEAQLPDGTILEFPDGTDPAVIQRTVKQQLGVVEPEVDPNILATSPAGQREAARIEGLQDFPGSSVIEPAVSIATGALAEPFAGVAGLGAAAFRGPEVGAETVRSVQEALTVVPETQSGQESLQNIGGAIQSGLDAVNQFGRDLGIPEVLLRPIGDVGFEKGGVAGGVIGATAPTAFFEVLGLGALRKLRSGTRLIDDAGNPTKVLRKELNKQGIVFENLTPEVKQSIPKVADKNLIPGPTEVKTASEQVLVDQIKLGGKDNSLATLKVVDNRLVPDPIGAEAVRQGFDEGSVQAAKAASKETKSGMRKMLSLSERGLKNRRFALDNRPTDIVGQSIGKRIQFIRDEANSARKQLNRIADTQLKGLDIDSQPVVDRFNAAMNDLDVDLSAGIGGVPVPDFKGSLISKDRTSQRVIKDLVDLMSEGGKPDALRFHKLKRQLDNLIDFRKKSAGGLSDAGRNVLKDIRRSINDSLRAASPQYAEVNDTMSTALTALDNFQDAAGPSINILGENASKAIGQDLRGLMSNRKTRIRLENAVDGINQASVNLGGQFKDDLKDLVLFSNTLDDRFGAVARTSLKGEVESAIRRTGQQGVKATAAEAVIGKVAEGADKLRGVSDFNAFRSMSELLNQ